MLNKTKQPTRKTGIEIVGDVPWGTHFCQFYQSKEDLIEILVPYFKAGLENNEFCMWVTAEPLNVEDAKSALKAKVKDLDDYIKKGQIEILDYSQWYTKTGRFDADKVIEGWVEKEKQAIERGFDGLRLTGNTFWLEKKDWENFASYEAIVNSVIGKHRMLAVCSYSLDKCRASEVIDVVDNHQFALIKKEDKWVSLESSEHKQAEEELREKEKKWTSLTENTNDIIMIVDNKGKLQYINKTMPPYTPKETVGKSVYEYVPKEQHDTMRNSLINVFKTGKPETYEVSSVIPKLGTIWFSTKVVPIKNEENVVNAILISTDITERKQAEKVLRQSEQRLRDITFSMADWVWEVDENGVYTYSSSKGFELFRHVIGKTPFDFMPPDEAKRVAAIFSAIASRKAPIKDLENWNIGKNGERICLLTNGVPMLDEEGNLKGYRGVDKDITERKQAEEKIKLFSDAIASAFDCLMLTDAKGNITYANESAIRAFGYTPEEFLKLNITKLDADPEVAKKVMQEIVVKGKWNGEVINIRKNKEKFPALLSAFIIKDDKGNPKGAMGILRDITERKRAEEAIKESERKLKVILDKSPIHIWAFDGETYNYLNKAYTDFTGLESTGHLTIESWKKYVHPDDMEKSGKIWMNAWKNKSEHDNFFRLKNIEGEYRDFWCHAVPVFDENGKFTHFQGYNIDITERKKAEERLKAQYAQLNELENIINRSGSLVFVWRMEPDKWPVEFVSDNVENILGYSVDDFISGRVLWPSITHQDDVPRLEKKVAQYLEKGVRKWSQEYRLITKSGEVRWFHDDNLALADSAGGIIRIQAVIHDITELKQAEEQLKALTQQLRASNQQLQATEQQLRVANQQLKVEGQQLKAEGQQLKALNQQLWADEEQLKKKHEQLRALASKLSSIEERERKHIAEGIHGSIIQPLVFMDVKVKSLGKITKDTKLTEAHRQMRTMLGELIEKSRTFTFDLSYPILYELGLEPAIEEWLRTEIKGKHKIAVEFKAETQSKDLDQNIATFLFKSVKELLINIVKHAKANNVKVSVARKQNNIILCVEDDGCGFESFHSGKKHKSLTGFGLFNIREQVTHLGGELSIDSKAGIGSKITLTVPVEDKA